MKTTAVILIILSIVVAIGAIGDFADAVSKRADWVRFSNISTLEQLYHVEDQEHQDAIVFMLACCLFTGGLLLFELAGHRIVKPLTRTAAAAEQK